MRAERNAQPRSRASVIGAPPGTLAIGVGLLISGLCSYLFLAVTARALGAEGDAPFASFWALIAVAGPGFFIPIEQEVARALAARRALGEGGRPVVRSAAIAASPITAALIVIVVATVQPLSANVFDGASAMVAALAIGLAVFWVEYLARGYLAGSGRFTQFGVLVGAEGVLRVLFCVVLAVAGVHSAAPFAFALVAGSVAALCLTLLPGGIHLGSGRPASWSVSLRAIGVLLAATLMLEILVSAGTIAVQLLARGGQAAAASQFLATRVLAFVPIFLFAAVTSPLLPRLSALAAVGDYIALRKTVAQLLLLTGAYGVITTTILAVAGPGAAARLFGPGFVLDHRDFALLGGTCTCLMLAEVLALALLALRGYARVAVSWTAGVVAFVITLVSLRDLFTRVELGLLVGSAVALIVMTVHVVDVSRKAPIDSAPATAAVSAAAVLEPLQ